MLPGPRSDFEETLRDHVAEKLEKQSPNRYFSEPNFAITSFVFEMTSGARSDFGCLRNSLGALEVALEGHVAGNVEKQSPNRYLSGS